MTSFDPTLLLQIFGVFFIAAGIAAMLGRWKSWYWRSQRMLFGYLPAGALFLLVSFEKELSQGAAMNIWILRGGYILLLALSAWGFIRPPAWLKPAWIRTIEAQPHSIYAAMLREVKANGPWREHVKTPEALEKWITLLQRQVKNKKKK